MYNAVTDFVRKSPHTAIYYQDKEISYQEVYDNVNRYRNKLEKYYEKEIIICMSDCPEWIYLFWGCVKAGIVPYLYSTMLHESDYKSLFRRYPVTVQFNDQNIEEFDKSATDITDNPPANTIENDLCFYMFTSGTTGHITRVPHQHKDLAFTAINYAKKTILLNAYDITFSAAKLFFAYGFGNSMTFPFFVGGSTVLMKEPSSVKNTLEHIEKYKPTVYFGVPSLIAGQIKSLKSRPKDLSSLRISVSAGEHLPDKLLNDWIDLNDSPILDGIGTTEALHIFITNRHEDFEPGCTGRLVPGYRAKILDKEGNVCEDNTIGHLWISGGSLSVEDEWMATGDMFLKNKSRFYYRGREKDSLKIGGVWVSPTLMENTILEHEAVSECAVIEKKNDDGLPKPKAFIVLNDIIDDKYEYLEKIKLKHNIKKLCMDNLPVNHFPQWIEFVDSLPRTATGKLRRHVLRAQCTFYNPRQENGSSRKIGIIDPFVPD